MSQKPDYLEENQVFLNERTKNKLFIKIKESPKRPDFVFNEDLDEIESNNSNVSEKSNGILVKILEFYLFINFI